MESGGLLNPSVRDKRRHTLVHKGVRVPGLACKATPQAPVLFNTWGHAPLPWEGERWNVNFYSAGRLLYCTPTWRRQLVDLVFKLPTVH